jgi:hypothetical protein
MTSATDRLPTAAAENGGMEYDKGKVDDMVLALLYLTIFKERSGYWRAWKSHDWGLGQIARERFHLESAECRQVGSNE